MLKNMKIGQRLLFVSIIIFIAFAVGIFVFKSSLENTDESYKNLMEKEILVADSARQISQLFEKCKRLEESFLRERNNKDLKQQKKSIDEIKNYLSQIENSSKETKTAGVKSALKSHDDSYSKIISSWKIKGYNQEDKNGLQFKFSQIANNLMEKVKKHQLENLYIKFMAVRIAEKDFYFKNEAMYKTKLDMALVNFGYEISDLSASDAVKQNYKTSLNEYKSVLQKLSEAKDDKRKGFYDSLANIGVKIESQIANLYIPQVKSLILQVRQDEKKYLLEGRKSSLSLDDILASYDKPEEKPVEENSGGGGGGLLDGLLSEEPEEKTAEVKKERKDMDNFEKTLDSLAALEKGFKDLEDNLSEEDLNTGLKLIGEYKDLFSSLVKEDDIINSEMIALKVSSEKLSDSVTDIVEAANESLKLKKGVISKSIDSSSKTAMFSSLTAVILGILLFAGVTQSITKPIGSAVEFADSIANKQLNEQLNINSSDEIGQLAGSLNKASENLNGSFKTISDKTFMLNDSSQTLSSASKKFTESFDTVDKNAASSIESTRKMTENLELVKSHSEKLNESSAAVLDRIKRVSGNIVSVTEAVSSSETNISSISAATEEMSATIAEIAENGEKNRAVTEEAFSTTDAAYEQVTQLISAAKEIEEIVNLIVEISDQTKTLSLNATIEAARAGEAGKGFAVVANEVKALATQTNDASEKIRQSIQKVAEISQNTTSMMDSVKNIVSQIRDSSNMVASAIEEQNITVKDNAANIAEAAAGLIQISNTMNDSSALVQETVEDIEGMAELVSDVNSSCLESTKENQVIVTSIDNIGKSVSVCKQDAEMLKSTSENLDEMAKGLSDIIKQFKLKA